MTKSKLPLVSKLRLPPNWAWTTGAVLLAMLLLAISRAVEEPLVVPEFTRDWGIALILAAIAQKVIEKWDFPLRKAPSYWFGAACLIVIGLYAGDWLSTRNVWVDLRYSLYQLHQQIAPHQLYPKRTALVLIGDEDYWRGELAGRAPIKRDYLAKLLSALDQADPAVIAIDFDLRSPVVDGSLREHPQYEAETQAFLEVVKAVARNRPVVLPRTVGLDPQQDYVGEPAIFDGFDFEGGTVRAGYISLPYDVRQVPLTLRMKDGAALDSFSEAIVRAVDEKALQAVSEADSLPYGSYIKAEDFPQFFASHLLHTDPVSLKLALGHKIVIIGGAWHSRAFERGALIDGYLTPVGRVGGAFVHANYVEALLDGRIYASWSKNILKNIDIWLAVGIAVLSAWKARPLHQVLIVISACIVLISLSYIAWQNLGMFFDFFIPVVLVVGNAVLDRIREWHHDAAKWRRTAHNHTNK